LHWLTCITSSLCSSWSVTVCDCPRLSFPALSPSDMAPNDQSISLTSHVYDQPRSHTISLCPPDPWYSHQMVTSFPYKGLFYFPHRTSKLDILCSHHQPLSGQDTLHPKRLRTICHQLYWPQMVTCSLTTSTLLVCSRSNPSITSQLAPSIPPHRQATLGLTLMDFMKGCPCQTGGNILV